MLGLRNGGPLRVAYTPPKITQCFSFLVDAFCLQSFFPISSNFFVLFSLNKVLLYFSTINVFFKFHVTIKCLFTLFYSSFVIIIVDCTDNIISTFILK